MYLTSDHLIGGKSMSDLPEDFSYIVRYNWENSEQMSEAIKILLLARLHRSDNSLPTDLNENLTAKRIDAQLRLASNPLTSEEILDYLSKIGDKRVCERIAINPHSPESALMLLANHPEPAVRAELSDNPACSITILSRLSKDEHSDVRLRLAENPNLPLQILEELSEDENPFVAAQAKDSISKSSCSTVYDGNFSSNSRSTTLIVLGA